MFLWLFSIVRSRMNSLLRVHRRRLVVGLRPLGSCALWVNPTYGVFSQVSWYRQPMMHLVNVNDYQLHVNVRLVAGQLLRNTRYFVASARRITPFGIIRPTTTPPVTPHASATGLLYRERYIRNLFRYCKIRYRSAPAYMVSKRQTGYGCLP